MVSDMPDLIDDVRRQIKSRLQELRPLVEEAEHLQRALDALATTPTPARTNGRRTTRAPARTPRRPQARPRGDVRAAVIEHVRANPGSTASDVADALNLKRTSIATRLTQLAKSGDLVKADRGYRAP
jgi:predicted transcriptional regulator